MAASASASTSTELPKYPSFSLVKSEVHYPLPLDMTNTDECYRTACFRCPPENTNDELDYTDHADGGPGMSSNIYGDDDDDDEEPEIARPRRAFRRRKNVLSIISEEDMSSSQSMEDDVDMDRKSERGKAPGFGKDANPKRKSKLGGAAKSLRQFFHRHARKLKKDSRRVLVDSSTYTSRTVRWKV